MAFLLTASTGCEGGGGCDAIGPAGQGPPIFRDVVLAGPAYCAREGLPRLIMTGRAYSGVLRIDRSSDGGITWETILDRRAPPLPYFDLTARRGVTYTYRVGAYWAVPEGNAFSWACREISVHTTNSSYRC